MIVPSADATKEAEERESGKAAWEDDGIIMQGKQAQNATLIAILIQQKKYLHIK